MGAAKPWGPRASVRAAWEDGERQVGSGRAARGGRQDDRAGAGAGGEEGVEDEPGRTGVAEQED